MASSTSASVNRPRVRDALGGDAGRDGLVGDHRGAQRVGVALGEVPGGVPGVVVEVAVIPDRVEVGLALEARGLGGEDHRTRLAIREGWNLLHGADDGSCPARYAASRVIFRSAYAKLQQAA